MGKLIEREDKLVLDTNYSLTHKINRAKIKKYLNPDGTNPVGGFHRNRFDRLFTRDRIGTHMQTIYVNAEYKENEKGIVKVVNRGVNNHSKVKFVQHYK